LTIAEHDNIPRMWANGVDLANLQTWGGIPDTAAFDGRVRAPSSTLIVPFGVRNVVIGAHSSINAQGNLVYTSARHVTAIMLPEGVQSVDISGLGSSFPNVERISIPDSVSVLRLGGVTSIFHLRSITVPSNLNVIFDRDLEFTAANVVNFARAYARHGEGTYIRSRARHTAARWEFAQ